MSAYDAFSNDYDRFVSWTGRLALEMPFLQKNIATVMEGLDRPARVLDSACGTGMHALELARLGHTCAGADISVGMIEQAQRNARTANLEVDFRIAGFGALAAAFGTPAHPFDALICLGNSLPHVNGMAQLTTALADFAACLRPGGLLLLQNRNFDAVMALRDRWMEPQASAEGKHEWVFVRFYDFLPDGMINFNILTLKRAGADAPWTQTVTSTQLFPLPAALLAQVVYQAGFEQIALYGNMTGAAFDPSTSGNLVLTARKV